MGGLSYKIYILVIVIKIDLESEKMETIFTLSFSEISKKADKIAIASREKMEAEPEAL